VARELLSSRGDVYQEPFPSILPVLERAGTADHVILKAHSVDDATIRLVRFGAIKAICTVRKPEDAVASWIEAFGFSLEDSIDQVRSWLVLFKQIRQHSLIVPYELIDDDPIEATRRMTQYLFPDTPDIEVVRIAAEHSKSKVLEFSRHLEKEAPDISDIGFSYYHTKTFFHRRHVSSMVTRPASDRIGQDAVTTIRNALSIYVNPNGDIL